MHSLREDVEPESGDLQLPMQGLYADLEAGRGSVRLSDEFEACSGALQIEILDAWLAGLMTCRRRALQRLYDQLCGGLSELSRPERLLRFRSTCEAMGIELPADFEASEPGR
jgi:hypothetical protein